MHLLPATCYLAAATVFCALMGATPAVAQDVADSAPYEKPADYSGTALQGGYIGQDGPPVAPAGSVTSAQPVTPSEEPPSLPPVFGSVKQADAPKNDVPPVADPCAEYADSYDGYNMCQDRIKKIERMREAKERRMGITPAPAPAPAPAATPEDSAKQAVEKVEELEKKMKEQEEAAAAKKAAPTTKKGIGDFKRNPEKGESVFGK